MGAALPIDRLSDGAAAMASAADWRECAAVARRYGRTFSFASTFLSPARRRAILAAYAYCRIADDIVDGAMETDIETTATQLADWEAELREPCHPVARAFAVARQAYDVPEQPVRDLIAGIRMDLTPAPFATCDELDRYCYHVAGTIGLIAAPIMGCTDENALTRAVELGIAMQLTNILRDVAEDGRMGRVYLPLEHLTAFGVDPESILTGRPNGRFRDLIRFEIERARELYRSAHRGIPALCPSGRLTVLAASRLYSTILTRIEEQDYDVFASRAVVPTGRKVRAMPGIAASFVRLSVAGSQ